MKKVIFGLVLASTFVACNSGASTQATTATDSTAVKADSTKVDSTKAVKDTVKVVDSLKK